MARVLHFLIPVSPFRAGFWHLALAWHQGDGEHLSSPLPFPSEPTVERGGGIRGSPLVPRGRAQPEKDRLTLQGLTDPFPGAVRGQDTGVAAAVVRGSRC